MDLRRLVASLLLTMTALVLAAPPALAHTDLVGSDPGEGAALPGPPQRIQLTFAEPVRLPADPITVSGPDGARWTVGPATVAGSVVTAPVQPTGPAGQHTLDYRIVSADGDPVKGAVHFTLTTPATPSTSAAPTTTSPTPPPPAAPPANSQAPVQPAGDSGVPLWGWIVGAVVLVGAGLAIALRLGRPSRSGTKQD